MAVGVFVLSAVQPRIVLCQSSFSGRPIALHGKGLNIFRLPGLDKRRRRRFLARCACSEQGTFRPVDVKLSGVTLYDLLGISRQVGMSEIKTAYREKARRYHPDANPPSKRDECTKKFLQVQEAYEVLADPDLRADYDYRLRHPLSMHALTSGLVYKGKRSRDRRSSPTRVDDEELANKQQWKAQWEAQVDGLKRDNGRRKPGSWAARMQQKRQETAAQKEAQQQAHQVPQQDGDGAGIA